MGGGVSDDDDGSGDDADGDADGDDADDAPMSYYHYLSLR